MDKQKVRAEAVKRGGGVRPFEQPRGDCAGYVAAWLRSRAQGKDFWATYFKMSEETSVYTVGLRGQTKVTAIGALELADVAQYQATTDRSKRHPGIIEYVCGGTRPDKPQKAAKHVLDLIPGLQSADVIAKPGRSEYPIVTQGFQQATARRCYALVLLVGSGGPNHYVGLDCTGGGARFFDPNIAEFSFASPLAFTTWFEDTWNDFGYVAYRGYSMIYFKKTPPKLPPRPNFGARPLSLTRPNFGPPPGPPG
jgi:hypothetical protein